MIRHARLYAGCAKAGDEEQQSRRMGDLQVPVPAPRGFLAAVDIPWPMHGIAAGLIGAVEEVLVEGRNEALGQWIGRTLQNRTLNFTHRGDGGETLAGRYLPVQVTRAGPNSLAGESMMSVI